MQPMGDGGVGPALSDKFQHLAFPVGQLREDCCWSFARDACQHAGGKPGAHDCIPCGGRVHSPADLLALGALEQVAACPGSQAAKTESSSSNMVRTTTAMWGLSV